MPKSNKVRKDEILFKQIQQNQNKEYQKVLKELSRTAWNDCNYSHAIKQQALYAAFEMIPQYRAKTVFQDLARMFEEELEVQEEIFTVEEEFKAKMMCDPNFEEEDVLKGKRGGSSSSKRVKHADGDYDENTSFSSMDTTLNSNKGGSRKTKNLRALQPDEPLENYIADFITFHHENIRFEHICDTLQKATLAKIVHQDCTETFVPKKAYEKTIEKLTKNEYFIDKLVFMLGHREFLDYAYSEHICHIILNICCGAEKIMKIIPEKGIQKKVIEILGYEAPKQLKKSPEKTKFRMKAKTALVWSLCEMASTNQSSKDLIMEDVDILFNNLSSTYLEFQKYEETDGLYWVVKLLIDTVHGRRINNEQFKTMLEHQEKVYGDYNLLYHLFEFCINTNSDEDSRIRWEMFLDNDYIVTAIEQVYFGDQEQYMDPETHGKRKKKILDNLATASSFAENYKEERPVENLIYLTGNIIDLKLVEKDVKEFKNMLHIIDQIAVSQPKTIGDDQLKIIVKRIENGSNPDGDLFNLMFEIIRSLSIRENSNVYCPKKYRVFEAIKNVFTKWINPKNKGGKPSTAQKQALELSLQYICDYLEKNDEKPGTDIQEIVKSLKKFEDKLQPKIREHLLPKIVARLKNLEESRN